jgi:hypothetical protein
MDENKVISEKKCIQQVRGMGIMFGQLYYHFATTLLEEFGETKGKELILKAIRSYGHERGLQVKKEVLKHGLELNIENFRKFSDLPPLGWEIEDDKIKYCPYADPLLEKGFKEHGILYCEVDFAKYEAYNPDMKVKRVKSLFKDDGYCKYEYSD